MSEAEATVRRTGALVALTSASALVPFTAVVGRNHVVLMLALFVIFLLGCAVVLLSPAHRAVAELAGRAAEDSLEILAAPARAATELRWLGFAFIMFYAAGDLHAEASSVGKVNGFILFLVFLAGVWRVNLSMLTGRGSGRRLRRRKKIFTAERSKKSDMVPRAARVAASKGLSLKITEKAY